MIQKPTFDENDVKNLMDLAKYLVEFDVFQSYPNENMLKMTDLLLECFANGKDQASILHILDELGDREYLDKYSSKDMLKMLTTVFMSDDDLPDV